MATSSRRTEREPAIDGPGDRAVKTMRPTRPATSDHMKQIASVADHLSWGTPSRHHESIGLGTNRPGDSLRPMQQNPPTCKGGPVVTRNRRRDVEQGLLADSVRVCGRSSGVLARLGRPAGVLSRRNQDQQPRTDRPARRTSPWDARLQQATPKFSGPFQGNLPCSVYHARCNRLRGLGADNQ